MRRPARLLMLVGASLVAAFGVLAADPSTPGALSVTGHDGSVIEMPLRHTKVSIEVAAFVARTTVEQVFSNPFDTPVEAVYTFPLGDRAAVDEFELIVGERTIRGEIRRRDEAREAYAAARAAGYQAALLEQERPNIFTQSVANLAPGKPVTVRLRTVETARYERGSYRIAFPLVVGPRYVPGGGRKVADAERIAVPALPPGTRSGHDVEIDVTVDAGTPLRDLESGSHRIIVQRPGATSASVRLAPDDTIPNRDFELRWTVASEVPAVGLLAHRDGLDGFFTLLVQPKAEVNAAEAMPKEITLVVDTSGSMSGQPLDASKLFIAAALHELGPRDTFNVVRFSGDNEVFSKDPLPNVPAEIDRAIAWVNAQKEGGGTEMLPALKAAFARPVDPDRLRVVVFFTDGEVGNDEEILATIGGVLGEARIYTVGIGWSVNRYLLDRMADLGRGAFVSIRPDEHAVDALEAFRSWVTRPYLTDLTVDWGALPVIDVSPDPIRDLGSGQTLTLLGRYLNGAAGDIVVRGKLAGRYWEQRLHVVLPDNERKHAALASLWARGRIENLLLAPDGGAAGSVRAEVTSLALSYRLMSPFTSFVAVDDSVVVNPTGVAPTIHQAVPTPGGSSLAAIFGPDGPSGVGALSDDDRDPEDAGADDDDEQPESPPPAGVIGGVVGGVVGGVAGGVPGGVAAAGSADGDGNPNVSGARERDFQVTVSGISDVDPLAGKFLNQVSGDSIEQVSLVTAGAGVEYGRARGGFAQIIADTPVAGHFYQNAPESSESAGAATVDDDDPDSEPVAARARLREAAFRLLADLADDGRLSPAEGKPALVALLAAQTRDGAIAEDVATHAIATWALAEAARAIPKDPWIARASAKAAEHLVSLATPEGWPKHEGGRPSAEATLWARLVLAEIRSAASIGVATPAGVGSTEYWRLHNAIAAGRKHRHALYPAGGSPFDRLVATIGRGHLRL